MGDFADELRQHAADLRDDADALLSRHRAALYDTLVRRAVMLEAAAARLDALERVADAVREALPQWEGYGPWRDVEAALADLDAPAAAEGDTRDG